MNHKILAGLILLASSANAQDLLVQTRVENSTFTSMIEKTRILMNNASMSDVLSGEVDMTDDDTFFTLDELSGTPEYKKFKDLFASIFKTDLTGASIRIRIPKISYRVDQVNAKPLGMRVDSPNLDLNVTAMISGIGVSLNSGLEVDLLITNPKTKKQESYLTARLAPTAINAPQSIEPLTFSIEFQTKLDQDIMLSLKSHDLTSVSSYIDRHMKDIQILDTLKNKPVSADSITVNPVTVRLNNLSRTLDFELFKPLLQKRFDRIVSTVISKVGVSLQNTIGPRVLGRVLTGSSRNDFSFQTDAIHTRFSLSKFSQPVSDQLYLGVNGELCTAESYRNYHEQCVQREKFPAPVRSISEGDRRKAVSEITENLARGKSDLVLSVSEEYLNRLLYVSIKAKLWESILSEQNLALGEKGAFLVFDKKTKNPVLYLDLLYAGEGSGLQSLIVNERKPLHFPLRIATSLAFENRDGSPHLLLKTTSVLSDRNEIINGIPKYDLDAKLIKGFKKKIASMILEMSEEVEGKTAVDLDLPILKNLELEKTSYEASSFGRLNLFYKW